jgi:hypothetical protein
VWRSVVDMQRPVGMHQAALAAAAELERRTPDDVLSLLDVADLHLELGSVDEALSTFGRLRVLDDAPVT